MNFKRRRGSYPAETTKVTMKMYVALLLSASAATAFAGLGGAPSAPGPRVLSQSAFAVANAGYTELKATLESGTEVHEYVNAQGTVFAVSWSGPFLPDLREVLGDKFDTMVNHVQQRPGGARSQVRLQQDDVVIFSGGRPGAFNGRAWIPALLPAGFDTNAVR
jgi:Protein of unknown function (DUF2844)